MPLLAWERRISRCTFSSGPRFMIHKSNRLIAATARAERMLDLAPSFGIDLYDLELVRRRLVDHEAEHERSSGPSKRRGLEKLIEADIEILASAYKKLEAAAFGGPAAR